MRRAKFVLLFAFGVPLLGAMSAGVFLGPAFIVADAGRALGYSGHVLAVASFGAGFVCLSGAMGVVLCLLAR